MNPQKRATPARELIREKRHGDQQRDDNPSNSPTVKHNHMDQPWPSALQSSERAFILPFALDA